MIFSIFVYLKKKGKNKTDIEQIDIYIYIYKLATLVEGDPKVPFSIVTTPRCRGGRYSFPWIAPL